MRVPAVKIALLLTSVLPAATQGNDAWQSLRFMIGAWDARVLGGNARATAQGAYTFQLELNGHILARHSATGDCKAPADFNCQHGDLLFIYRESPAQPLQAIYFDDEGHTIHYGVTTPAPNTAVFLSASKQPGPQYRLIYELKQGVMQGRFQLRMPGQSDFTSYLEWSGGQRR